MSDSQLIEVYLEVGSKKAIAGAVDWPGWCRSGRDEASALQALIDYGSRYARVVAGMGFAVPADVSSLVVTERLAGNGSTDYGVPNLAPQVDLRAVDEAELARFHALTKACWQALDAARQNAIGKELRKGPRGGGRELENMIRHVLESGDGYLGRLAWKKRKREPVSDLGEELNRASQEMLDALDASVRGQLPKEGPRGGVLWSPRFFVRRALWHILDHAWELDDRVM